MHIEPHSALEGVDPCIERIPRTSEATGAERQLLVADPQLAEDGARLAHAHALETLCIVARILDPRAIGFA